mmetsp:Transcript_50963/g.125249  ORF Transcript_50963/g.125249 Transcript_50963/m.125249 type:complete len:690 (+) Transcript_50963:214-2283(+)
MPPKARRSPNMSSSEGAAADEEEIIDVEVELGDNEGKPGQSSTYDAQIRALEKRLALLENLRRPPDAPGASQTGSSESRQSRSNSCRSQDSGPSFASRTREPSQMSSTTSGIALDQEPQIAPRSGSTPSATRESSAVSQPSSILRPSSSAYPAGEESSTSTMNRSFVMFDEDGEISSPGMGISVTGSNAGNSPPLRMSRSLDLNNAASKTASKLYWDESEALRDSLSAKQAKQDRGTNMYHVMQGWFGVAALVAFIAVILTTVEFVQRLRNPVAIFEMDDHETSEFPVVTICPIDRGLPYFPNHFVSFPTRRILDLYSFRLLDDTACSNKPGSCFDDYVERGWVTDDPTLDCAREYSVMSVEKFSTDDFLNLSCKYCFRLGVKGSPNRETSESYLSRTETLQFQVALEYFECMLDVGGIPSSRLGDGDTYGSLNYQMKHAWRSQMRDSEILDYSDNDLGAEDNADFESATMCNLLFFSGFFLPTDNQSDIRYRWNAQDSRWEESGAGPYFQLRKRVSIMYTLGFEIYFQLRSQAIEFSSFQKGAGVDNPNARTSRWMQSDAAERHSISPATRPLRAPLVLVGGFDQSFISLTRQNVRGNPFFSWTMSSFPVVVPPESPHTNNIEYGLNSLLEENLRYEVFADHWAWLENCFGWIGSFTGLSIYTLLRRPIMRWLRKKSASAARSAASTE